MTSLSHVVAIVEDDLSMRTSLARLLRTRGFQVQTFATAEQYLEKADPDMVACVLIDFHLGDGLSGLTLAEMISRSPQHTPLVLMSAAPTPNDRVRAAGLGCLDVLMKPFAPEILVAAIARATGCGKEASVDPSL
jgi:FixJ family two-component response regulator